MSGIFADLEKKPDKLPALIELMYTVLGGRISKQVNKCS